METVWNSEEPNLAFGQFLTETDLEMTKVQLFQLLPSLRVWDPDGTDTVGEAGGIALLRTLLRTIIHPWSVTEHT